jgi:hypothetical protein
VEDGADDQTDRYARQKLHREPQSALIDARGQILVAHSEGRREAAASPKGVERSA